MTLAALEVEAAEGGNDVGYFGANSFENDDAADWIATLRPRTAVRRIEDALRAASDFSQTEAPRWSQEKIESFVSRGLEPYRSGILKPPEDWRKTGRSLTEFLEHKEKTEREYFSSGRYLDEQYGPVEVAIAAAEVVAMWGGQPNGADTPYDRIAAELVEQLKRKAVATDLVQLARECVKKILSNARYERMRKFYLDAFPGVSRGDDSMGSVRDLLERLNRIEIKSAKSIGSDPID